MTPTRLLRNTSAGVVATIAAAASYTHMRTLAAEHGQSAPIAAMVPLSVDGLMVVATIAMHDDKHTGRPVRRSAWAAFVIGVTASVTANVLAAPDSLTARVISAWPAVALLLVVELLTRTGRAHDHQTGRQTERTPQASTGDARPGDVPLHISSDPAPAQEDRPDPAEQPGADRTTRTNPRPARRTAETAMGPDVSDLLKPGRTVRDRLAASGDGLTRRALIEGLRADGHTVSTARASTLLRQLAAEPDAAPTASDRSSDIDNERDRNEESGVEAHHAA